MKNYDPVPDDFVPEYEDCCGWYLKYYDRKDLRMMEFTLQWWKPGWHVEPKIGAKADFDKDSISR